MEGRWIQWNATRNSQNFSTEKCIPSAETWQWRRGCCIFGQPWTIVTHTTVSHPCRFQVTVSHNLLINCIWAGNFKANMLKTTQMGSCPIRSLWMGQQQNFVHPWKKRVGSLLHDAKRHYPGIAPGKGSITNWSIL